MINRKNDNGSGMLHDIATYLYAIGFLHLL